MAGHMVTPYEFSATRSYAKKKKDEKLMLASLSETTSVDILDVIEAHVATVAPIETTDGSRRVECVRVQRDGDRVRMVFAADHVGEREVVHDGADAARPAVFEKRRTHITRYYSVATLWRPPAGDSGILLVHSPWGRGGTKGHIVALLQRAANEDPNAKAKLHAHPLIPASAIRRILNNANSTRITYQRDTGVQSTFGQRSGKTSAKAEMALVVKGSDTIPYRNALTAALKSSKNRDKFFTVEVRDESGKFHTETFDDVEVTVTTAGGTKNYSIRDDTMPTLGFNLTPEIGSAYWALPVGQHEKWPAELLDSTKQHLDYVLADVTSA